MISDQLFQALYPIATSKVRCELQRRYYHCKASCQAREEFNALTKSALGCLLLGFGLIFMFMMIGLIIMYVSFFAGLGLLILFGFYYFFKTLPSTQKEPKQRSFCKEILKKEKKHANLTLVKRQYSFYRPPRLKVC